MCRTVILLSIFAMGCAGKDGGERELSPYLDSDQDGFPETEDCNDRDPSVHPEALELCDAANLDENCDGEVNDPSAFDAIEWFEDKDGDGFGNPDVTELGCTAPIGYVELPTDCDDEDSSSFPTAVEMCDDVDNDCDGAIDEGASMDAIVWYEDSDGDGFGTKASQFKSCDQPEGYVCVAGAAEEPLAPSAASVCSDRCDNDLDGLTDDEDPDCADTLGNGKSWDELIEEETFNWGDFTGELWVGTEIRYWDYNDNGKPDFDCDDSQVPISPGVDEQCDDDDVDENCDNLVDDEDPNAVGMVRWFADLDNDGFGNATASVEACDQPPGKVINEDDCDDANSGINPDSAEVCGDGIDNDCDEQIDEEDSEFPLQWYRDVDGDGYGDAAFPYPVERCSDPSDGTPAYVTDATDCDDSPGADDINPGAEEIWYDGIDQDCDDNDDDRDGDGYVGDDDGTAEDCDDEDPLSNPGAPEICGNGDDNNCDGLETECNVTDTVTGMGAYDRTGASASIGGSVDGDDYDDVLLGASRHDADGLSKGAAFLMSGAEISGDMNVESAAATLVGETDHDRAGSSVAIVGDTNSDGFDDFVVGAFAEDAGGDEAGSAYLVLGPVSGAVSLADADAKFIGEAGGDHAGLVVASAGDTDGDGNADFYIGAPAHDDIASDMGASYLVRGPISEDTDLSFASVRYIGAGNGEESGSSIASAGDFDGDGYDDALIGAPNAQEGGSYVGAVYLVLSLMLDDGGVMASVPFEGTIDLAEADARWHGVNGGDQAGYSVASAGDQNDDGYGDIIIGAPGSDMGGAGSGAAFIVYGGDLVLPPSSLECETELCLCPDGFLCPSLPLADADAKLVGERGDDFAGGAVSGGGDINGDSISDVAVGSRTEDSTHSDAGAAYVMFGPLSGTEDLSSSMAKQLGADAGDWAGAWVDMSGDIDNDGTSDMVIGAPQRDQGDFIDIGMVFLLKGGW